MVIKINVAYKEPGEKIAHLLFESASSAESEVTDFEISKTKGNRQHNCCTVSRAGLTIILEAANSIANSLLNGHQLTLLNVCILDNLYKALIRAT